MAFADAVLSRWKLIAISTLVSALVTYSTFLVFAQYNSTALLDLDEPKARAAESIMRSSAVSETVLVKFPETGDTPERRRRFLQRNFRLVPAMPSRETKLFEMQMTDREPAVAMRLASAVIDRWLELTKPGPIKMAELQANLTRAEAQATEVESLIGRLLSESKSLILPNSMKGELASPLQSLLEKRDEFRRAISKIKAEIGGLPRDVVLVAPNLPSERSTAAVLPAVVAAAAVLILMTLYVELSAIIIPKLQANMAAYRAGKQRFSYLAAKHPIPERGSRPEEATKKGVSQLSLGAADRP